MIDHAGPFFGMVIQVDDCLCKTLRRGGVAEDDRLGSEHRANCRCVGSNHRSMHPGKLICLCRQHEFRKAVTPIRDNADVTMNDKVHNLLRRTRTAKCYTVTEAQFCNQLLYKRQVFSTALDVQSHIWDNVTYQSQCTNSSIKTIPLCHSAMIHYNKRLLLPRRFRWKRVPTCMRKEFRISAIENACYLLPRNSTSY